VTSRGFSLPKETGEMDGSFWFNFWMIKLWPYNELQPGDELFWYESPSKMIVWRTRVSQVEAFPYASLQIALDRLDAAFGGRLDRRQPYLVGKPNEGYCLGYRVDRSARVDRPKPEGVRFNRQGWERDDRPEIADWLYKP
jgi:hypothetical protein